MRCCNHGNTDGDCLQCLRDEIAELRGALYDEQHGMSFQARQALLQEALDAMLNLAPLIKRDRGGCFGGGGVDCECTACKIRRELLPNAALTGDGPQARRPVE